MGDTFRDPIDHMRTTRPHAGRAVIDVLSWPGYSLIIAGMLGAFGSITAFATSHGLRGVEIAVIAVIAGVLGTVWVMVEHRRIDRIARRWHHTHPICDDNRQAAGQRAV
ncbi:MAG TPA: protein UsfY [Mycobacterium sp.]|nr:protein UsfY [Mycobacterium sp.]